MPFRGTIALTPVPVSAYLPIVHSNHFTKNCIAHVFTVQWNVCMQKALLLPTAGVASCMFWFYSGTLPKWEDDNSECHLQKHWYFKIAGPSVNLPRGKENRYDCMHIVGEKILLLTGVQITNRERDKQPVTKHDFSNSLPDMKLVMWNWNFRQRLNLLVLHFPLNVRCLHV